MWKRDVFCEKCGMKIDSLVTPEKKEDALVESLVLTSSRMEHREKTGCEGDHRGWRFGPWKEVRKNEEAPARSVEDRWSRVEKEDWPRIRRGIRELLVKKDKRIDELEQAIENVRAVAGSKPTPDQLKHILEACEQVLPYDEPETEKE